jgi:hypothetical protein
MKLSSLLLILLMVCGLFGGMASAAVTVTTIKGEILKGDIVSVVKERLTLKADADGGEVRAMALANLICISYETGDTKGKAASERKCENALGDWSLALRPVGHLSGKLISWNVSNMVFNVAGTKDEMLLEVPVTAVSKLWRKDATKPDDADADSESADRIVVKTKSDKLQQLSGKVGGVDAESLLFQYRGKDRKILAKTVVAAVLYHADADGRQEARLYQAVHFGAEQVIPAHWTAVTNDVLQFKSLWGQSFELHATDVKDIAIENGNLQYLSALRPTHIEQLPFFDRVIPLQLDRSLDHEPIKVGDTVYDRGISVHSRTVLTYQLGGKFSRFCTTVGFQQSESLVGNVYLRVLGDGKVLFEIEDYGRSAPAKDLDLDVHGVRSLTLEVGFGKRQDVSDRIVWANARLLVDQPAE